MSDQLYRLGTAVRQLVIGFCLLCLGCTYSVPTVTSVMFRIPRRILEYAQIIVTADAGVEPDLMIISHTLCR